MVAESMAPFIPLPVQHSCPVPGCPSGSAALLLVPETENCPDLDGITIGWQHCSVVKDEARFTEDDDKNLRTIEHSLTSAEEKCWWNKSVWTIHMTDIC